MGGRFIPTRFAKHFHGFGPTGRTRSAARELALPVGVTAGLRPQHRIHEIFGSFLRSAPIPTAAFVPPAPVFPLLFPAASGELAIMFVSLCLPSSISSILSPIPLARVGIVVIAGSAAGGCQRDRNQHHEEELIQVWPYALHRSSLGEE